MKVYEGKKILIIRFSSIGDIVLTTPVIRCLRQQLGAEIHFLVKKQFAIVLLNNPFIEKIHEFDGDLLSTWQTLRRENFDLVVDLHKNLRSFILRILLFKKVISYKKMPLRRWLRTKFAKKLPGDPHICHRFLQEVQKINVRDDGEGLDFFVSEKNEIALEPEGSYTHKVAIIPGAQHFTKCIRDELIENIIESNTRILFYLLGGKLEEKRGGRLGKLHNTKNYCGKINLQQSASIIQQSDYVISGDTGLMHVAAAQKKNIIAIWGSTVKEFGYGPYYGKNKKKHINVEVDNLDCRPCTKIGKSTCPKGHFKCMRKISTRDVLLAMNEMRDENH